MNIFLMFCNMKYGIHLSHFRRMPKHNGYLEENHMHNYLTCKLAKNLSCLHAQPLFPPFLLFEDKAIPHWAPPAQTKMALAVNQDGAGRGTSSSVPPDPRWRQPWHFRFGGHVTCLGGGTWPAPSLPRCCQLGSLGPNRRWRLPRHFLFSGHMYFSWDGYFLKINETSRKATDVAWCVLLRNMSF